VVIHRVLVPVLCGCALTAAASAQSAVEAKRAALESIAANRTEIIDLSEQIWRYAETALKEHKSSKVLADAAERHGFRVERGVAGMPTAFIAEFGAGEPVIGILGEFDALPGLSQKVSAERDPLVADAPGHGCGHNLFGPASLAAAIAIKDLIESGTLSGTIRYYGTPAEEAVGGKIYMARDGLFNDVDVCLAWHPSDKTQADTQSTQALVDFIVEFRGRTAHAAYDPWNGRSAVDALELTTHGLNLMREHIKPSSRIHYAILEGGLVPNVVPERAKLWCWLRDWERSEVDALLVRVRKIVAGAAMMAEVEAELIVQSGDYELLVNMVGARLLHENLNWVGPVEYTDDEQAFAKAIQRSVGIEETGINASIRPLEGQPQEGGSTDVGDVSWVTPVLHLSVTCAPEHCPWHHWAVVACAGSSIGHKGMDRAAKVLAATMVDLFEKPQARAEIRREFEQKTRGHTFSPYIPDGPPPVPDE